MCDLDRAIMRAVPRSLEPLRLLVSYLEFIQEQGAIAAPELRCSVASHIQDLTALALGANKGTRESALSAVAAARLAAALSHIADHFTDESFRVESVAQRLGVSSRYLQQLLEASGTSFTARVNGLRLQKPLRRSLPQRAASGGSRTLHSKPVFRHLSLQSAVPQQFW